MGAAMIVDYWEKEGNGIEKTKSERNGKLTYKHGVDGFGPFGDYLGQ